LLLADRALLLLVDALTSGIHILVGRAGSLRLGFTVLHRILVRGVVLSLVASLAKARSQTLYEFSVFTHTLARGRVAVSSGGRSATLATRLAERVIV